MIKVEVWSDGKATAFGPFPFPFVRIVNTLSGRKIWKSAQSVKIDATPANLRVLKSTDYEIEFIDREGIMDAQATLEALPTQHAKPEPLVSPYTPGIKYYDHQENALALSWEREVYALLFEMGLGKTAIIIANAGMLHLAGRLTGILIIAPKGVHRQWIEEEIPKHLDKQVKWNGVLWNKKRIKNFHQMARGLTFFAMNSDAIRTKDGLATAEDFVREHRGKLMIAVDESHDFKGQSTDRTRNLMHLRDLAMEGGAKLYRRISSGTPIAKDIVDAWSQFNFLDSRIIGQKYLSAFKARYCIIDRRQRDKVVGQINTEEFYSLIAPHCFRLTKAEALDLPPKIYVTREYEMGAETRRHYDEMKETLLTSMEDGTIVDGVNAAVALLRLHQIVCGHLSTMEDEKKIIYKFGGERIEVLLDILRQTEGPTVVWCRFIPDRHVISEALTKEGISFAAYAGTDAEKSAAKADFLAGRKRVFISNQASGGTGLNLQGECANVIYYSNSFNAVHRWQSEDRTHRIGMKGAVTYFDITARKSVDRTILRNLKAKKDLADLTLDEIRKSILSEV